MSTDLDEIDPADSEAVFYALRSLEERFMWREATTLLERMLESPTPSATARENAKLWIACHGAPPEKAYKFAHDLVREQPDDFFAWETLGFAADECGLAEEATRARARAAELVKEGEK